jgi:DNA mismatch repair ATPase MutS
MPLVTCIRVSDSLRDGQSYFFAEVQRMKGILQKARQQNILFLIDEPLRGTNNRERLIGNQKYLQQVLEAQAFGFISTHDLELTALADASPFIANYHFSEQWDQGDLLFDYKIKAGPSKTTNALKILQREGLIPSQASETPGIPPTS